MYPQTIDRIIRSELLNCSESITKKTDIDVTEYLSNVDRENITELLFTPINSTDQYTLLICICSNTIIIENSDVAYKTINSDLPKFINSIKDTYSKTYTIYNPIQTD